MYKLPLVLLCVATCLPLAYGVGTAVDKNNFEATVINSEEVWVLEYFSPRCGTCQDFVPIWDKVAKKLQSQGVNIGSVNIDNKPAQLLAEEMGVFEEGIPYVQAFSGNGPTKIWTGYDVPTEQEVLDLAAIVLEGLPQGDNGKMLKK
eukprot:CAMPEP_0197847606 /NCGR_PEP_ID=MMETSP1438-20131217/6564_1 /TAXON_ID=1461541 /ORGANISM="Pterosperma sp., Strain CCMP1384" /LENGTH=146 /DNA_ID=CAMNT_0043459573 /DNA_START=115 /DNA_END=555 /DNA_ORIENTATION=-